ncbi:MAG: 50S ribosomal protein L22 [Candidatus Woesearchaeota archaeon]|nr:MAG: 50S ribosomal protein L22 [Candidatus Woesearchaeota archaeon]
MKQKESNQEHIAIAKILDLPISTKHSVEVCNFVKNKSTEKAKRLLNEVIKEQRAVPFKKYYKNVGHRVGKIGSGRYPKKATREVIKLIEQAEANAQDKGLDAKNLVIKEIKANKGQSNWHPGRIRRIKMKRTHLEITVEELESKESKPKKGETKK